MNGRELRGGENRNQKEAYEGGNEMRAKGREGEEKTHQRENAGPKRGTQRRGGRGEREARWERVEEKSGTVRYMRPIVCD